MNTATQTPQTPAALNLSDEQDGAVLVHDPEETVQLPGGSAGEDAGLGEDETAAAAAEAAEDAAAEAAATDDAAREAIRERRRQERKHKKEAAREREDNYKSELAARDTVIQQMQAQLAQLQARGAASDLAQLDASIKRAAGAADYWKSMIGEASKKQDGATVAEATERMVAARAEAQRLASVRENVVAARNAASTPVLDASVRSKAEAWMSHNTWYKADGSDQDSAVVLTLDRQLAQEGYDPRQGAYWDELQVRVQRYLPHRAPKGYTPSGQGKPSHSPVAGSGRESGVGNRAAATSGATYRLSPERVKALKDAGVWDNPQERNDAIRRYRQFDMQRAAGSPQS